MSGAVRDGVGVISDADHIRLFGPGAVLELPEADYRYGVGMLAIRLTKVGADPAHYRAMEWVTVEGFELFHDGSAAAEPRWAMIRVSAIPAALRPTTWRPPNYPPPPLPVRRVSSSTTTP
jgi:hypothetical protein